MTAETASRQHLMQPFQLGPLHLKNRVVMAPMTRSRAGEERLPNALMAEYYAQRATAGLIITEATVISNEAQGWLNTPGVETDQQAEGWKQVVDAVHGRGTPIILQLWHCGRASHSSFHRDGAPPVAPSPIKMGDEYIHTPVGKQPLETPRALDTDEIPRLVNDFRLGAEKAKSAGFDGIEIHGANGYLIDTFLQSRTNHRSDAYGGSVENRFRLLREIVEGALTVFPAERIGVRLSPNGNYNDMGSPDFRETFTFVAGALDAYDLAYLHVMDGLAFGSHGLGEPMILDEFRALFRGAIMGNCGYDQATAEDAVGSGRADLIAFGRPYITNPDLVRRFAEGLPLADPPDPAIWFSFDAEGYTSFPAHP